jgi:hypothetical protein
MVNDTTVASTSTRNQNRLATARKKMRLGFADLNDLKCLSDDFEMRLNSALQKHQVPDI